MPYKDKNKLKEYKRNHAIKNKDKYLAFRNDRRIRNKEFVLRVLRNNCCSDCGIKNPIVLEFDHICESKKKSIADLSHQGYSLKSLKDEMRKCEIVCANCHRIRTAERANYYRTIN